MWEGLALVELVQEVLEEVRKLIKLNVTNYVWIFKSIIPNILGLVQYLKLYLKKCRGKPPKTG